MSEPLLLSILMPAVFDRDSRVLCDNITMTVMQEKLPVELLALFDNRKRSIGLKRNVLLGAARGQYVMHLDDDDDLSPDAVQRIVETIATTAGVADVISFDSKATIDDGNPFRVRTGIAYPNEQCSTVGGKWQDIRRKPWHWCAWKRTFAVTAAFPDGYIDEDAYWLRQLWGRYPTEFHIDSVLHRYRYNSKTSLAQQGVPTVIKSDEQKQWEAEGCPPPPRDVDEETEHYDIGAL